ncbi:MAG: hypothetical protein DCC75_04280 [Proteobacteria bacterium]|nr:MAG: hypothetical protein DCC75_04280 [Pseudomonadota bacterium]
MPSLSEIHTVLPNHGVPQSQLGEIGEIWLKDDPDALEKFVRISGNSGVKQRYFSLPYQEILSLNGLGRRAELFGLHGGRLLSQVVDAALSETQAEQIGHFIFTSCSVPLIPSIDAAVVLESRLPRTVARIPIYQHGCAGGVVALALASKLAALGKPVLVSAVELCSLVFQPQDHAGAQLVGAAIFGDGAAALVVEPQGGQIEIVDAESYLISDSRHLMGYDIFDDGFYLRLDRSLPQALVQEAPRRVADFLSKNGLAIGDIDYWLFHPGGVRILEFLEEALDLQRDQCRWSREVLSEVGNLSSASVLFVLKRFMEAGQLSYGERALMLGIGPGLTIETVLMEKR